MSKLKLVSPALSTEQLLREALTGLDEAERTAARLRAIVAEQGRALWHERNPGSTLFGHLRIEAIRGLVER